jgi:16S rRNA (uracil1498-N3)-methyltransferase
MNLMLLTEKEAREGLPLTDARARHLLKTLHIGIGARVHVGIRNSKRGIAVILTTDPRLNFGIRWEESVQTMLPLDVIVGLPRPQSARKILHDLSSLGARKIRFFRPAKGDPAYATSTLWTTNEWLELVEKGAEQACSALIPEVAHHASLAEAISACPSNGLRMALDPYEATGPLGAPPKGPRPTSAILAIGPERGWDGAERTTLRDAGFELRHLGDRILRVESACVAGGTLCLSTLGVWQAHRPLIPGLAPMHD